MRQVEPKFDPAPSRWSYRYQRLMLTPLFRKTLRIGLPFALALGAGIMFFTDPDRQEALIQKVADLREQIETRPEFMVQLLEVEGASAPVEEVIREVFPFKLPISSFDADLDAVRVMIEDLPAVADASVRIRKGGVLVAKVVERQPIALWRVQDGLNIVDVEGVVIGKVLEHPKLMEMPIIAGAGAEKAVPEALSLSRAAKSLDAEVRGLVRVGERRWDVVMESGQRIMLPVDNPQRALERVIVLDDIKDMLNRDLSVVDMRIVERPTIRMNENAADDWWQVSQTTAGAVE
ncbi:cell division protein FtsQ [Roseovarius albus]|uniref:Cell division protein FtsQ n=1 Tax=Roseovarius albus TaxID=1247867 RepID=A0A1X6Y5U3_9RHOB|nr:cell division protein FtsQ/DivIB [Roseovarius albus]SLN11316.1 cell division protein FtsQ [Roseovarius albus]